VAVFYNPGAGKRMRLEYENNLGYQAVGEVDSYLETFADWKQPRSRCIAVECVGANRGRTEIDRVGRAF
jgi:hypothetical protein